jgi:ParE toxin of type II toxin-antitoxin system, parDE
MAHRLAPHAERDLDDIWLYIAKESGSIEVANRLVDTVTERFLALGLSQNETDVRSIWTCQACRSAAISGARDDGPNSQTPLPKSAWTRGACVGQ